LYELSYVWGGDFFNEILFFLNKKFPFIKYRKSSIEDLLHNKKTIIATCQPICKNYSLDYFKPSESVSKLIEQYKNFILIIGP
jgi:hypothetical protein